MPCRSSISAIAYLATLCVTKARAWYADDRGAPAAWEPSGADFLSPTLMEAELMRRIAEPAAFGVWLTQFLRGSGPAAEGVGLDRSYVWIAAGCVVSLIFVGILGPGVHF